MKITGPGIAIDLPRGWEAEIDGGAGHADEDAIRVSTPRVHMANFPLPAVRGDFGSGAVERMIDGDVLLCLLEEAPSAAESALHGHDGIPRLRAEDFSPDAMQRPRRGQSGTQAFFHDGGRAFVLYAALGGHGSRLARIEDINRVLAGITITPA